MRRSNVSTELLLVQQCKIVDEFHQAILSGTITELGEVTERMIANEDAIAAIDGVYTENITMVGGMIHVVV